MKATDIYNYNYLTHSTCVVMYDSHRIIISKQALPRKHRATMQQKVSDRKMCAVQHMYMDGHA